ncbi:MAG TPA: hypothetical protein VM490_20805 [Armatimonadaceae bacterium]|nr:hypothetical protein [Armatimonadaceae bacterium]
MLNTSTRRRPLLRFLRPPYPGEGGGFSPPRSSYASAAAVRAQQRARQVALAILFFALAATIALTARWGPDVPHSATPAAASEK